MPQYKFEKDTPLRNYITIVIWDDTEINYKVHNGILKIYTKTPISNTTFKTSEFNDACELVGYSGYTDLEVYQLTQFLRNNIDTIVDDARE